MKPFRPMTKEWEAEICNDLRSGMRLQDVATKHHIGKRRVMAIRDRNGIKSKHGSPGTKRRQEMTPEREAEIVADLRSGMVIDAILQKYHIGYEKLSAIQDEYGLFRQRGKRMAQEEIAFYDEFDRKWDAARFMVLDALNGKPKKAESWIKL